MRTKEENKANQILIENDWFRDYYYIQRVIKSCKNDVLITNGTYNSIKSIMNARKWGFNLLDDKRKLLCDKYPKLRNVIEGIYYRYMDNLRGIFEYTFEKLRIN